MNISQVVPCAKTLVSMAAMLGGIGLSHRTLEGATVDYVVQVSLDGLGGVYLEDYVTNTPEDFPNFVRLMSEGAYTFNARCDFDYSETVPNHITMFTARPVQQPSGLPETTHHGYANNFPGPGDTIHADGNPAVLYKASMFDVAHDHGLTTAFHASKTRLEICNRSYDALNGALDLIGEDNGTDKIDMDFITDTSGANITNEVNGLIEDLLGETPTRYSFIHIAEPDLTGHGTGWNSAPWRNIVQLVDRQLGRILDALESQPSLRGRTALIITADHGGGGVNPRGHTEAFHRLNYTIPFFLVAPGVLGGTDLYSLLANRGDPGTNRTDYTSVPQPIRDGDASNLALALLGLPPIPDSFMIPDYSAAAGTLAASLMGDNVEIRWADPSGAFVLEQSPVPHSTGPWSKVVDGISVDGVERRFTQGSNARAMSAYFRLRRISFTLVRQPNSQSAHAGTPVQLSVEVSEGASVSFRWFHNGALMEGVTGSVVDFTAVGAEDAGEYYVEVSDGTDTISSAVATLEVLFEPVITLHPMTQIVQAGTTVVFAVEAEGAGSLTYQWQKNGIDLEGADGASFTLEEVDASMQGAYRVIVTDQNGSATSDAAQLSVIVPLSFVAVPANVTNTVGSTVTLTVTIEGNPPPFTYVWYRFPLPIATNVTSERTVSLVLTNVTTANAGSYLVNVSNEINPTGINSFPLTRVVVTE